MREQPSPLAVAVFALSSAGAIAVKLHGCIAVACTIIAILALGGWREILRTNMTAFRAHLDVSQNATCQKCVCTLKVGMRTKL